MTVTGTAPQADLTFGWGVHFSLGAHLARSEVCSFFTFFTEVLRRGLRFKGHRRPGPGLPQHLPRLDSASRGRGEGLADDSDCC